MKTADKPSKKKDQPSKKKRLTAVLLGVLAAVILLFSLGIVLTGLYFEAKFEREVPEEFFSLTNWKSPPKLYYYEFDDRANRVGERKELTVGSFPHPKNPYVPFEEFPKCLPEAFVAIEDKRFYSHRGVDWLRTAEAGVSYLLGSSDRFGASTITQQTVKNMTGNSEISVRRKLQEIFYALDLERNLDKNEILELYLNVISFSDGCTGIGEAAEHYFSKEPKDLTVEEAACLAAITNQPSYYNPIHYPEHNLERRNLILTEMWKQGFLSEEACRTAVCTPLNLTVSPKSAGEQVHSWYTDMVLEDVIESFCKEFGMSRSAASLKVHTGGLEIEIAMDPEIQKTVEDYYKSSVHLPENSKGESAQSALIVIDSRTGDILGVAGAVGEKQANRIQNFATQALRSPGSSIKPLTVYAPALEEGIINWASVYDDVPVNFGKFNSSPWPKNANGTYRGLTNIAYAVAHSTNTVAVRVLEDLGLKTSFGYAKNRFHLSSLVNNSHVTDCDVAALALGQLNYGLTLREITCAYTALADGGSYHSWHSFYRVTDSEGNLLLSSPDHSEPVLSEGTAAVMTKLLEGVVEYGTSSSVTLGTLCECAGKTGTTQNDHDRWFIGYTPDYVCGVWCGYEYPEELKGSNLCTGIWNSVMRRIVLQKGGRETFAVPADVLKLSYCKDSGMLTSDACLFDPRGSRTEAGWFVRGSEPRAACNCHTVCHINRESGGILHGPCPEELRKKVSLIRAERHFPMQIYVTDAQFVFGGLPMGMPENTNPHAAYFEVGLKDCCGRSETDLPFNRSGRLPEEEPPETEEGGESTEVEPPEEQEPPNRVVPWDFPTAITVLSSWDQKKIKHPLNG